MPTQRDPEFDRAMSNLSSLMDRMGDFKDHIETRLIEIKAGQDRIEGKFERLGEKFNDMDKRVSIVEGRVEDLLNTKNKMIWLVIALVISFAGNVAGTTYQLFLKH